MSALICFALLAVCAAAVLWPGAAHVRRAGRVGAAELALSVLAALFLFWLCETGLRRRLLGPAALFSFAADGVFLPGRAAVLLLCVLLCLGLGLTAPGRRLLGRLRAAAGRNGLLWFLSFVVAALFFLWAMRVTVVRFMTNDETHILKAAARTAANGISSARGAFSSVLFVWLLSLPYRLAPEGWWYAGYHLAVIFAACVILGRCVLLLTRARGRHPLWGCLVQWLALCGLFFAPLAELSFTITSGIAGAAACALILCRDETPSRAGRIASDAGAVLLFLLCWLQRESSGEVLLCFIALSCAVRLARLLRLPGSERRRGLVGLGAFVLAGACLFGAVSALDGIAAARAGTDAESSNADYYDAEYYRSIVMDYLGPQLTAEQLEAAGIPAELGNLMIMRWYFMDERVNTETFRRLVEMYYHPNGQTAETGLLERLGSSYTDAAYYLRALRRLAAAGAVFALLAAALFFRAGKTAWPELVGALCAPGGGAALCVYAMLQGRFLYRVFLVIAIPAVVIELLCCLAMRPRTDRPRRGWQAAAAVLAAGLCVLCGLIVVRVPYADEETGREEVYAAQRETEACAFAHPDTYFVTNFFAQNLDPFHGGTYPTNMGLWGGSGVTALPDEERMFADDFFRDDVRFMCELPGSVMLLLQYLTLDNGPVAARDEAHLTDNITVFDLDRIGPGGDYTGWYEWQGKTYYFERGEAVVGTQVIDGETYEFAPGGASSPMFLVTDEEGTWYATTAYTLQ